MSQQVAVTTSARDAIVSAKDTFVKALGGEKRAEEIYLRESGFAIMAMQNNTKLQACTPESLRQAVICVALTGLSLNPTTKQAYLIPRGKKATLDVSYMGMIEILRNSGSIKSMRAAVVYEGEAFDYKLGSGAFLTHKPLLDLPENARKIAAYAIAVMPDGHEEFEIMRWSEVMKRKKVSASGNSGPWASWEDEMAKKTVMRSLYKLLPKSPAATEAFRLYDEAQNQEPEKELELQEEEL